MAVPDSGRKSTTGIESFLWTDVTRKAIRKRLTPPPKGESLGRRIGAALLVQGFGEDLITLFRKARLILSGCTTRSTIRTLPQNVVRAMSQVVRLGGYLAIQGWCREGTWEGWIGLHHHELFLERKGRRMCQPRSEAANCIRDGRPPEAVEIPDQSNEPRGWMRVIYRRTS